MFSQGNQGQGRNQLSLGGPGFWVKGVACGIGLVSESIHHYKEKKAAERVTLPGEAHQAQAHGSQEQVRELAAGDEYGEHGATPAMHQYHPSRNAAADGKLELEEGDEEQWDLDDAQDLIEHGPVNPKSRPFERDPTKIIQHFMDDYPVPPGLPKHGRLDLPVVLPQRRPKDRSRGFIRAYAPELMKAGVNEAMFLDFLETFNTATQASPWLNAINMAGFAFMPLAPGISQAATIALYLAVKVMKNMQSRHRYSSLFRMPSIFQILILLLI